MSYAGSKMFLWLADSLGMPVDQINFVLAQFTAVLLAAVFRTVLHPSVTNAAIRHWFGLIVGITIGFFCYGEQAVHLAGLPTMCYIIIRTQKPQVIQRSVMAVSLTYLSAIHMYRMIYDYGSYGLDITGPLMVITQKVTTLAFNIHDGFTKTETEMTKTQKDYAVKHFPSALEYYSYILLFPTLMVGPLIYYKDYIDFVTGNNFKLQQGNSDNNPNSNTVYIEPSPVKVVLKKVFTGLMCAIMFVKFSPQYPIKRIKSEAFLESASFPYKFWFIYMSTTLVRFKYYFAWSFADAICNNSGIGLNGFNKNGEPKWDKFSNVDILGFELSTNLRGSIESWNMGTNSWLRFVVYDRVKNYQTILTYALSALWHGFYPGYYLTFAGGALFTFAARTVRRLIRPHFIKNDMQFTYDVLTFMTTRVVMAYITFSFVLLEFSPSVRLYSHLYWCLHILALTTIFLLPKCVPKVTDSTLLTDVGSKSNIVNAVTQAASLTREVSHHHD